MKVIKPGLTYDLQNLDNSEALQRIQFPHKEPNPDGSKNLITIQDGTTNEEVIRMLIDRLNYQHSKFPSRETALAITKQEESLMWLEKRTADRKKRGVEGQHKA